MSIKNGVKRKANQNKLNAILESNYANLYRIAYAWCQDEHIAKDLVQDTMLKALQKAEQITSFENLDRWLCKIMHNIFYDNCRKNARYKQIKLEELNESNCATESVETIYIKKQSIKTIHDAIGILPVKKREIIILIDLQGYSYKEVSEVINIPVGTVMSRLSRARDKLKNIVTSERILTFHTNNIIEIPSVNKEKWVG